MFDVVIIGGGPAGISAAIYAARYRLKTCIFAEEFGGQVTRTHRIENYPGFSSISGTDLSSLFRKQLDYNKVDIFDTRATQIMKKEDIFLINNEVSCKTVLLALGMKHRKLNIPGEADFLGRGVSYCATCDAAFFRDKTVCVVGGNDSAAVAADILSQHAKKVYIIYRKERLRCEPAWLEHLEKSDKIEIINNTNVTEIKGSGMVESVSLDSGKDLPLQGVFIEIGSVPSKVLTDSLGVAIDNNGFILTSPAQETNIEGVYAAGDITTGSNGMRQIATAISEGAIAAQSIFLWLKRST